MLALTIFLFLLLSVGSLLIDLIFKKSRVRVVSFLVLMLSTLLVVIYHYRRLGPLTTPGKVEIQGQYYPLNASLIVSGDSAKADYYAPSLLHSADEKKLRASPALSIGGYDDRGSTLEVVATGMAGPLRLNGEMVNVHLLQSGDEIAVGSARFRFENGIFSRSQLAFGDNAHTFSWPSSDTPVSVSELLCRHGLDRAKQLQLMTQTSASTTVHTSDATTEGTDPLEQLWVVRKGWWTLGLVNGSANVVKVNGIDLPVSVAFKIKSDDKLSYGIGRRSTDFTVQLDPAANRIYILPDRRQSYPLYLPPVPGSTDVFVSSAETTVSPAYQLPLGERNRDLVKGSLRYNLDRGVIEQFSINSGLSLRSFKVGEAGALGSIAGGVLISLRNDSLTRWLPLIYVGVVWLVTILLFLLWGGVTSRNYLFVLIPGVQMILAVRLILSYRAYALPPYYVESYEKALFALIFVPFALLVWLYIRELSEPFDMTAYVAGQRKLFGRVGVDIAKVILTRPPFSALVISCALLWLVGISTVGRMLLVVAFFVASVLIAALWSYFRTSTQGANPLLDWLASDRRTDVIVLFAAPLVLPILFRAVGLGTEVIPFTGLRAELIYLPSLLLGSCRFYMLFFRRFFAIGTKPPKLATHLWLILPVFVYFAEAFIVGDWGFMIYSVPVLFLAMFVSWEAHPGVSTSVAALSLLFMLLFFWTPLFTQNLAAILPKGSALEYRYLAYQNEGWLQEAVLEASDVEGDSSLWRKLKGIVGFAVSPPRQCIAVGSASQRLLSANEHFWTMFHFAARGSTGVGYGKSPIERVPFTDGIAQSDNTYSIYVMSEHGSTGGIALLSLYLWLSLLTLFVLTQHFANQLEPALIVGGVSLTILFAALYHASGNVNGLPFTGKNLPLLSLNSTADILLIGLLLGFAFSIIGNDRQDLANYGNNPLTAFASRGNTLNRWLLGLGMLFALVFFPATCFWTVKAAGDEVHRKDYDLGTFVAKAKQYIDDRVIELDDKGEQLILNSEKARGLAEKQYLRLLRDQFNAATYEEKRSGKYFFIISEQVLDEDLYGAETPGDRYRETVLDVDENYFRRTSPFAQNVKWRGDLQARDEAGSQGYLSGEGLNLYLRHVLDAQDPIPGANSQQKVSLVPQSSNSDGSFYSGRRFRIFHGNGKELFDLYAIEADTVLDPIGDHIYVNGQGIRDKTRLEPGDIVAIKGSPQINNKNLVFTFRKESAGLLARSHWRNGREEFAFPQGKAFALARPIVDAVNTQIGDLSVSTQSQGASEISQLSLRLTIATDLNRKIHQLLVREAEGYKIGEREIPGVWQEVNGKRGLPPRLAVTAMDPGTGEVLALASWPSFDPNPKPAEQEKADPSSYSSLFSSRSPESKRFLMNHNFTRHVLGSATKPFIAAAAASAFPELLTLIVEDNAEAYESVLGVPTKPGWQGQDHGRVDWNRFLAESNNLYAVTLGFMAVANGSNQRLSFSNRTTSQQYQLEGSSSSRQPHFSDIFKFDSGEAVALEHSSLARQMQDLFDIRVSGPDPEPMFEIWRDAQSQSFLPQHGSHLSLISSESTNLSLNSVDTAREFVGVCLGGNTNLWSNVKSAEAFSRLITGRKVHARMVGGTGVSEFDSLMGSFDSLRLPLMEALEGVARLGGTASELAPTIAEFNVGSTAQAGERFTVFAKTGTLEGQYRSGRNDSNIIFAAGMYNPSTRVLRNAAVVSIFVEKGNRKGDSGRATLIALRLMESLNEHFRWKIRAAS